MIFAFPIGPIIYAKPWKRSSIKSPHGGYHQPGKCGNIMSHSSIHQEVHHVKIAGSIVMVLTLASSVLAQQQAAPQGRGATIEPRIMTFEARPSTIRPGESVQLVWQTEATGRGLTIEP